MSKWFRVECVCVYHKDGKPSVDGDVDSNGHFFIEANSADHCFVRLDEPEFKELLGQDRPFISPVNAVTGFENCYPLTGP